MIPKQYGERHLHQGYDDHFHGDFEPREAIGLSSNPAIKPCVGDFHFTGWDVAVERPVG